MVEFRRDPNTGKVYAYRDGILVGEVPTMGDAIIERGDDEQRRDNRGQ